MKLKRELTMTEASMLCQALQKLPLRTLAYGSWTPLKDFKELKCDLPHLRAFHLTTSDEYSTVAHDPWEVSFVCQWKHHLQSMELLAQLSGLPDCVGDMQKLLRLDVRGNFFGRNANIVPLPAALSKLTNLVDFVGFGQSPQKCPTPTTDMYMYRNSTLSLQPEREDQDHENNQSHAMSMSMSDGATATWRKQCRANYWYRANVIREPDEDDDLPWQCPDTGWKVQFDDPDLPFWKWRNLEKFWVDANFFYGSIPSFIADRWPNLRTLDLYNNELSGAVPKSVGKLTQLTQIQLQDNDLSGELPSEVINLPLLQVLRVAVNKRLTGAIFPVQMQAMSSREHDLSLNHAYSGIKVCRSVGGKRLRRRHLHCKYPTGYSGERIHDEESRALPHFRTQKRKLKTS
jgi:hypothetical protein